MSLRERQLALPVGEALLRIVLHDVLVLLTGLEAGKLRFRVLGSVNSDEPPLYRLSEVVLDERLQPDHDLIVEQAIALFAQYTGARVIGLKR
ncbi:hypothetical protein IHQ56_14165 [Methylobacillus flagellatus]|uniref:hypothetical protein n=1 Tax=Methylobacillus flagellatus TaxID=405 RepID=UPI002853C554|nr:hypothetical protein [Methylobacillus flagellatus]MDR5172962.1 hypothetical protein [Methylobacillus flagellatus]